jgi:hypothetical protein
MSDESGMGRLLKTCLTISDYCREAAHKTSNHVEYCRVLHNIMETCRLELTEQRKLGIKIPEPEPFPRLLSWHDALCGMQGYTHLEEEDHGKGTDSNSEGRSD